MRSQGWRSAGGGEMRRGPVGALSGAILTVEVEQRLWGDGRGGEHKHLQAFQALSADLCCHLLVDLAHVIQLQHLQAHAVPRWSQAREKHRRGWEAGHVSVKIKQYQRADGNVQSLSFHYTSASRRNSPTMRLAFRVVCSATANTGCSTSRPIYLMRPDPECHIRLRPHRGPGGAANIFQLSAGTCC